MSTLLYTLGARLFPILASVGIGTNLALYQVVFALLSGRFLGSRGALFPALADTGLSEDALTREHYPTQYR